MAEHPSSNRAAPAEAVPLRRLSLARVLLVLVLAIVTAAGTLAALYFTQAGELTTERTNPAPPRPPGKTVGTVKFTTVPADSTIMIDGKPVHVGSPWDVDLPPGAHQIEIRHDGYKSWLTSSELAMGETLTIRVPLEPLDSAASDASLPLDARAGAGDALDPAAAAPDVPPPPQGDQVPPPSGPATAPAESARVP